MSAEKVRNAFLGMGQNHKTLLAVFRRHNEDYAKQVGKMKSQRSYWKYCTVYNHLEEFIKHRYKVSDIVNELMEHFKEQSVINFIALLSESHYTARYVLSNSKRFGLLPKTLPNSTNISLRSRKN